MTSELKDFSAAWASDHSGGKKTRAVTKTTYSHKHSFKQISADYELCQPCPAHAKFSGL